MSIYKGPVNIDSLIEQRPLQILETVQNILDNLQIKYQVKSKKIYELECYFKKLKFNLAIEMVEQF